MTCAPRHAVTTAVLAALLLAPSMASARDLYESDDGEFRLQLNTALKGSWLLSFPPDDPVLEESTGGAALFRLRFTLDATLTEYFNASIAYEHRALASSGAGVGTAVLPPNVPAPFRLTPGDWSIIEDVSYNHRHEIDRAFVALHLPFLELTAGRQAIGLGRGMLFSAVDILAPFSPTEVDREWRRGVDAIHAELRIPEISELSADFIVAFGDVESGDLESYAMLGRVRALIGDVDASVLLGRRGEDNMVGAIMSATIGDASMHAELSLFGTDGRGIDGGLLGTDAVVAKGLIGAAYMIDIHRGVNVIVEYHYSGFGVENIGQSPDILFDPAFQARFARGDSQTLGRHTLALVLSAQLWDDLGAGVSYIQGLTDGSGVVAPSFTWTASDMFTLVVSGLIPWGTPSEGGIPTSEFGSGSTTVFVQARLYD